MLNLIAELLSKPLYEILIIIAILVFGTLFILNFIIRIIRIFRSEGTDLDISLGNLFSIKSKGLEQTNKLRKSSNENGYLMGLDQHIVFANLNRLLIEGAKLTPKDDDKYSEFKLIISDEFLKIKIGVFYIRLKEFVKEFKEERRYDEKIDMLNSLQVKMVQWINEYGEKSKVKVFKLGSKEIYGIPEVYITEFNTWHSSKVNLVFNKITEIIYSNFYPTPELKLILIMEYIDIAFKLTIEDAQLTLLNINGELEKILESYL